MSQVITPEHVQQATPYSDYEALVKQLAADSKSTGPNQSEALIHFTQLNSQRMERINKRAVLSSELTKLVESITQPLLWIVLTESWCGDAAQNIPYISKIASLTPQIELKVLLRDENLEVMDAYLTNGGRSIPKLICLRKDTLQELGNWGPRPAHAQKILLDYKANPGERTYDDFHIELHTWYARNKGQDLQQEFLELIKAWANQ